MPCYHFATEIIFINWLDVTGTSIGVYHQHHTILIETRTIGEEVRAGVKPVDGIRIRVRVRLMGLCRVRDLGF